MIEAKSPHRIYLEAVMYFSSSADGELVLLHLLRKILLKPTLFLAFLQTEVPHCFAGRGEGKQRVKKLKT